MWDDGKGDTAKGGVKGPGEQTMANVAIWKEGQSLLSPHNSWGNVGRLEGHMLDRKVLCNPPLSLALFNVKGQAWNGMLGKEFLYCCLKLPVGNYRGTKLFHFYMVFSTIRKFIQMLLKCNRE